MQLRLEGLIPRELPMCSNQEPGNQVCPEVQSDQFLQGRNDTTRVRNAEGKLNEHDCPAGGSCDYT